MYHDAIWFLGRVPIQCIINQSRWMKGPRMMMDEGLETSIFPLLFQVAREAILGL